MYELPPILQGSERQQIAALRDYLVRIARQRGGEGEGAIAAAAPSPVQSSRMKAAESSKDEVDIRGRISKLRSLILKTADSMNVIVENVDEIRSSLHSDYLAASDFATFVETIDSKISATARGIVEEYDYSALIQLLSDRDEELEAYLANIRGEIRRGLITDPETGETAMGIAISESLRFTGETRTEDGLVYYELSPGQTLGLYTANGWQFWINGSKRGWFDSGDGMLHVTNIVAENSVKLGVNWEIGDNNGLGIKYIGG